MLVVEDDPLIREMVVEHLQEQGFEVLQAADGKEALPWCKRREADVPVTDVVLPGGIGSSNDTTDRPASWRMPSPNRRKSWPIGPRSLGTRLQRRRRGRTINANEMFSKPEIMASVKAWLSVVRVVREPTITSAHEQPRRGWQCLHATGRTMSDPCSANRFQAAQSCLRCQP